MWRTTSMYGAVTRAGRWVQRRDGVPVRLVFERETGRLWTVWATRSTPAPGARTAECVMLDADAAIRRVWGAPPGWEALSDAELLAVPQHRAFGPA